ncbi:MAG: hypothetical protein HY897_20135 [Deltaproteobacteria bacterium]|nr:hypothetical protein [Deltaproteobacteria bacterium]
MNGNAHRAWIALLLPCVIHLHGCMDAPTGALGQHCRGDGTCDGDLVCNDANFCMPMQHVCVPETGIECTCWDGSSGTTSCKADGSGYRECEGCPPAPDGGCGPNCIQPQCSCKGIECGDNGCGHSCGECAGGKACRYGACVTLGCDGKACGDPDGYGGQCVVPCANGAECKPPDFNCSICVPECDYVACGTADGCGGTCDGYCSFPDKCVHTPAPYHCEKCVPDCNGKACGNDDGCGVSCEGVCAAKGVCMNDPTSGWRCCIRSCASVDCGGTDYSCGLPCEGPCPFAGQICNSDGQGGYYCSDCVADCAGKQCGGDNLCGGNCAGACTGNDLCVETNGIGYLCCTPDCAGKSCGDDDGCGRHCAGPCPNVGSECVGTPTDHYCTACVPDCPGKACGEPDQCGTTCEGTCPAGQYCADPSGQGAYSCCTPDCAGKMCQYSDGCGRGCEGPCSGNFKCEPTRFGGYQCVACTPACAGKACGESDGCNSTCNGTCADPADSCQGYPGTYACGPCVPSCDGKKCGAADGCGGTCHGRCANGMYCLPDHGCVPDGCEGKSCGETASGATCPGPCAGPGTKCDVDQGTGWPSCAACGAGTGNPCTTDAECDCGQDCFKLGYLPCAESPTCPRRGICLPDCSSNGRACTLDPSAECLCTATRPVNSVNVCLSATCVRTGTVSGSFSAPVYDDCATATIVPGAGDATMMVDNIAWSFNKFYACRIIDASSGRDFVRVFGLNAHMTNYALEIGIPTAAVTVGRLDLKGDGVTIGHYGRLSMTPPKVDRIWTDHVAFEGAIVIKGAATGGAQTLSAVIGAAVAEYQMEVCSELNGNPIKCSEMK